LSFDISALKSRRNISKLKLKQGTDTGMDAAGIEQLNKELSLLEDDHKDVKEKLKPYKGLMTDKEIDDYNHAHLDARMGIDKILTDVEVNRRFDNYEDAEFKEQTKEDIEQETRNLHKENEVLDRYTKPAADPEVAAEYTKTHKKKGFSAYAIDPKSLTVAQKRSSLMRTVLLRRSKRT
jgi:hypothetical protein